MLFRRTRPQRMRCLTAEDGRDVLDVSAHIGRGKPAVALRLTDSDALILTPQQVGWLRGQLRERLLDAAEQAECQAAIQDRLRA